MQRVFDIFKSRWPEVVLVVVLQAGLMLLLNRMLVVGGMEQPHMGQIPDWATFLLGFGCALMAVIWQMLYLGFLRTAVLNGDAPHEPLTLLLTGRPFFWRLLAVQFLLGLSAWLVSVVLAGLLGVLTGLAEAQPFPQWLLELAAVGSIAVLIKPFFLTQAYVLALDCSPMEAFWMMWRTSFVRLTALHKAYAVGLGLVAVVAVASALVPPGGTGYTVASAISFLTQSAVVLTLMLATVLLVAQDAAQAVELETDNEEI